MALNLYTLESEQLALCTHCNCRMSPVRSWENERRRSTTLTEWGRIKLSNLHPMIINRRFYRISKAVAQPAPRTNRTDSFRFIELQSRMLCDQSIGKLNLCIDTESFVMFCSSPHRRPTASTIDWYSKCARRRSEKQNNRREIWTFKKFIIIQNTNYYYYCRCCCCYERKWLSTCGFCVQLFLFELCSMLPFIL